MSHPIIVEVIDVPASGGRPGYPGHRVYKADGRAFDPDTVYAYEVTGARNLGDAVSAVLMLLADGTGRNVRRLDTTRRPMTLAEVFAAERDSKVRDPELSAPPSADKVVNLLGALEASVERAKKDRKGRQP